MTFDAETSSIPVDVGARIRAIGNSFTPETAKETFKLYVPLHEKTPKDGVKVHKDISYGPDGRHLLDVFEPAIRSSGPTPIVVFVHGGGLSVATRTTRRRPISSMPTWAPTLHATVCWGSTSPIG